MRTSERSRSILCASGFDYVSPHFGKISEMKSISEPLLPKEIHTHCQNLSLDEEEINIFWVPHQIK
jgi:hypothetical protein